MTPLRQRMVEELQRRNYSPATIRGYVLAVKQFAEHFGKPPDRLGATQVQRFQWYLLQERKLTPGTVEMRMSALRFFFKKMLKRRDIHFDDLPFPKTPRRLSTVLSPEEVRCMIDARYTHRVAISNHRLLSVTESEVRFRWKDYANHNKKRTMTLTGAEFLRRFLQHLLPQGFPRIRYFGWLANRKRGPLLQLCRALLAQTPEPTPTISDEAVVQECPKCRGPISRYKPTDRHTGCSPIECQM